MIQYFFCFLIAIASFGYTKSIDECSCDETIEVYTIEEDPITGTDIIVN